MTFLDMAGGLNSLMIVASLYGIWAQLRTVLQRQARGETATDLLSLNQFSVSYFAYWSFFLYGLSVTPINHYLVWPRLAAALLVLGILLQMARERGRAAKGVCTLALLSLGLGLAVATLGPQLQDSGRWLATVLILGISLMLAQGYGHQILLMWREKRTGAIDVRMSQWILAMDLSTLLLVTAMGWQNGWPLAVLAITSALTKVVLLGLYRYLAADGATGRSGSQADEARP